MKFSEYWATRGTIDYDEMVEAKKAFDFQQSRIAVWHNVNNILPDPVGNWPWWIRRGLLFF